MERHQSSIWLAFAILFVCLSSVANAQTTEPATWGRIKAQFGEDAVSAEPKGTPEGAYPNYCFFLNVPWICQVPPGDWGNTKNCGQACGVMLGGYFNRGTVASWVITAENQFLASRFNDPRFNSPNGYYTNFSGRNALGTLLREFHALNYAVYNGNGPDDVVAEMARGRPVIVGVMISGGRLVSSGGIAHWALAVGWDGAIYLNDPGSINGRFRRVPLGDFFATWNTQGRIYVPVWK